MTADMTERKETAVPLTDPRLLRDLAGDRHRARLAEAARERLVHRAGRQVPDDAPARAARRTVVDGLAARLRWVTSLW